MELIISCDASIKLKKLNSIKNIDCNVVDFDVIKDTLSGNIKINGTYIKDDLDKIFDFEEIVPFTVVFRDDNFTVEEIVCGNFSYQEIVNQGIECHFDVFITYHKQDETKPSENTLPVDEEIEVEKTTHEAIKALPEAKDEEITVNEDKIETNENVLNNDEQISKHYDEMLEELLEKRNDNFLEEDFTEEAVMAESDENEHVIAQVKEEINNSRNLDIEASGEDIIAKVDEIEIQEKVTKPEEVAVVAKNVEIKINSNDQKEKVSIFSQTLKENYRTVSIYYLHNEVDVDRLCQKEKLDLNHAYEEYNKNRRIIIK